MKQLIFVLLFVCGVVCAHGGFRPIKFRNCKSEFEVLSVEASDCGSDDSNKCPFKRNTEPTIRIGFKPNRNVNSLKANVRAKLEGGAESKSFVSFALENENACQGSNITCPLVEGKTYFYSQSVKVAKEYPLVDVQVNWLIVDPENSDSSKREICIIFLAKVSE